MSDYKTQRQAGGTRIYSMQNPGTFSQAHSRKDLYKISLLSGTGSVNYKDRSISINGPVLLVTNPGSMCALNLHSSEVPFYTCVITRKFLKSHCFNWVNQCGLFSSDHPLVYKLSEAESRFLGSIFQNMLGSQNSAYPFKSELIQEQICVLLHTAFSMTSLENPVSPQSGLVALRKIDLLNEMQFPPAAQVLHFN